jgi:hypothetical protein
MLMKVVNQISTVFAHQRVVRRHISLVLSRRSPRVWDEPSGSRQVGQFMN